MICLNFKVIYILPITHNTLVKELYESFEYIVYTEQFIKNQIFFNIYVNSVNTDRLAVNIIFCYVKKYLIKCVLYFGNAKNCKKFYRLMRSI